MQLINRVLGRFKKVSKKQLAVAGVFTLALAGSVTLGLITKQHSFAYNRDCSANAIDNAPNNGGCGADTAQEFIADLRQNQPSDLQNLASKFQGNFNLSPAQYDDFAAHAMNGTAFKDGHVEVNGQTVLNNIWSIGRTSKSYSWAFKAPGDDKTYYASKSTDVFLVNSIPVIVFFANDGSAQFVVEKPCGNLIAGEKVKPNFGCNAITKEAVAGKENTYKFGVNGFANNNAVVTKVTYDFGDGATAETNSLDATVEHTYTKVGEFTATVRITVGLPGGKTTMTEIGNCKTTITVKEKKVPFFACTALIKTNLDNSNTRFRFTTNMSFGNGAQPKSAAFTLDGTNTTSGVTDKDAQGNFFKDYTFTDSKAHTVSAQITFTVDGKDVVSTEKCEASVSPFCPLPGKENFPPNAPECQLPNTGMGGNITGLFAGTSAFGAAVHGALAVRRNRKAKDAAIRENIDVSKYL